MLPLPCPDGLSPTEAGNSSSQFLSASGIAPLVGEAQAWLLAIIDAADDAIISKDLNGTIISWNPGAERLFGYTAWEALGQNVAMLVPADRADEEPAILDRIREGKRVEHYETVRRRKDGSSVEVSLTVSPVKNARGEIVGASKIAREITDKHRAEETTRRLAAIVESSDDAILSKDLNGVIQSWNPGAERLFGYTAAEAIGRPVTMLIPLGRHNEEPHILARIRRGERIEHYETVRRRKDGTLVDVSLTVSPIRNTTGRVIGASKIARDVTDRKQKENASRLLAAIVESSDDAIVSKNLNSIIQTWNRSAERLFGYSAAEAIGKPVLILIPEGRESEEPAILEKLRRGERLDHFETIRRHKDGTLIDVSLTVSPIFDATGKVIGASKIARDVGPQKKVLQELREAHAQALAANRAKDDFLAALSHELRTPLNPVLLVASECAADRSLPDQVRRDFESIRKNVELEARLIDDLLDLARITNGKLQLNKGTHDLHTIIRDALATVRSDIDAKNLALTSEFASPAPLISGDAIRLQQVFWNVLKNAAKFTPEYGRISISTRVNEADRSVAIEISDTGVGLMPGEQELIFNSFAQGTHTRDNIHRFGGLGLGLAISRLLTELHQGSIRAQSEGRGKGSTFLITLPLEKSPARIEHPAESVRTVKKKIFATADSKPRVLLVEDHDSSRNALALLLARRHCEVVSARSGAEARSLADSHTFDFLICDIGLPDTDGSTVIADLKTRYGLKAIALTGLGMEDDIKRCLEAGALVHLTKPVSIHALENALATTLTAD